MNLDGTTLDGMTLLTVSVAGEWSPAPDMRSPLLRLDGQWVSAPPPDPTPIICLDGQWVPAPCREWHGSATAAEQFFALTIHHVPGACHWMKTQSGTTTKPVRLDLLPTDCWRPREVRVRSWVGLTDLCSYAETGTEAASPFYRPDIAGQQTFQSGVIQKFTQIDGDSYEVLLLFLARKDVRTTRFGLWYLRPELAEFLPSDLLRKMLGPGRTGHLRLENS